VYYTTFQSEKKFDIFEWGEGKTRKYIQEWDERGGKKINTNQRELKRELGLGSLKWEKRNSKVTSLEGVGS